MTYEKHDTSDDKNTDTNTNPTKTSGTKSPEERLYPLLEDISDIRTFYQVYNNYPWDRIRLRDSVHLFKQGVQPFWEDAKNVHGGCWTFRVPKAQAREFWHQLAIVALGNEFGEVLGEGMIHSLQKKGFYGAYS